MRAFLSKHFSVSILVGFTLIGALMFSGCTRASDAAAPIGTEVVVFIDFSESVKGASQALITKDLLDHVVPTLTAGDRILIAPITDKTLTRFHPLVDVTFPAWPAFNGWSDNRLQHQDRLDAVNEEVPKLREQVRSEIKTLFARSRKSPHTDIFSSMTLAEKLFHNIPQRKVLIIMSDMIEDYPPYRFDKVAWNDEKNEKLLNELDGKGLIPNLSGVCVYVAGPSARTPDMAGNIGTFWQAYFDRAQADFHPSRYAHVLLHWPPEKACFRS